VALPPAYAEWAARSVTGNAVAAAGTVRASGDPAVAGFRITSPRNGDKLRFVPGVDRAYATVALRAAGAPAQDLKWFVDGKAFAGSRWPIEPGVHRLRAVSPLGSDEVAVEVIP
jgi:hypothetical protein